MILLHGSLVEIIENLLLLFILLHALRFLIIIKLLIALATKFEWKIHHLDVKFAFLNGLLDEYIFVEQPKGFQVLGSEDKVYKLKKALYRLKQALRAW